MITLYNISKIFNQGKNNEIKALHDISLSIENKEFVVIVGANGSGKTTLLNIISGAEFATSGSVKINGKYVTCLPEYKRSKWISRVFQNPLSGTAPELTILDNFRLAALRTTTKKMTIGIDSQFKNMVREKISVLGMGLENKLEQPMGTLSGGQRQALTLLMSVMDNARILLLDEPTAALDPKSAQLLLNTANKLIKEYELAAIYITHNIKDAYLYGTRLIQMQDGKIIRDIAAAEKQYLLLDDIYRWFETRYV